MSGAAFTNALPQNYRLEEYALQSVLGHGGFGITYLARDTRLGALVAIKEYFPQAYAQRAQDSTIRPNTGSDSGDAENYQWGLQEFLKEARALAQFKHPNIVRVLRFLEANGTAYMVMEYEEGEGLSEHIARHGGFLSEPTLLQVFLPVLNGLQAVHDAGLLHLDIKPDNIYLRRSGQPMLIDFGASRQRQSENRSQKIALTPGYAALEQYPGHGELGPWSDVYSMGATLYRCIVGKEPMDARERANGLKKLRIDPLIPATRFERPIYSAHIRTCVDAAMALDAEQRPRSALALQNGLMGKDMNAARATAGVTAYSRGPGYIGAVAADQPGKRRRYIPRGPVERLVITLVFLAVMIVAPVRIMVSLGYLDENEVVEQVDALQVATIENGKLLTRYLEENLLGVKRAPEFVPPPGFQAVARANPAAPVIEEPAAPPFDTGKQLAVSMGVPAPVMSLAFLQNGRQLALALDDGRVEVRNAETGVLLRAPGTATGVAGVVAASTDGRRLAFAAANYSIQLWDAEKSIFLSELPGHLDQISALAFSPDGQRLVSTSRDQSALLWDVDSGRLLQDLSKPANEPLSVAFSPDGGMLAIGDTAGGIRYWNLTTLRDIAYVPTRDLPVTALAYAPNGKFFAVGTEQGFLSLWDVSGRQDDRLLAGAPESIHALAFSPDSKWLLVAGSDKSLQLWDVATATLVKRFEGANHQNYALAVTVEGDRVAAAGIDNRLTLWR